jgi:hypothetical protein
MEEVGSYSYLKDFDWSIRLILSSDKISGLRKPVLLLKLESQTPNGKIQENTIELNTKELENLITSLKKAQEVSVISMLFYY